MLVVRMRGFFGSISAGLVSVLGLEVAGVLVGLIVGGVVSSCLVRDPAPQAVRGTGMRKKYMLEGGCGRVEAYAGVSGGYESGG